MTTKGLAVEAAALRGAKLFLVEGLAVQAMASRGSKLFHVETFRREAEADLAVPRMFHDQKLFHVEQL